MTPEQVQQSRQAEALAAQPAALIAALWDLKRAQSPSSDMTRSQVEIVIRKIHSALDQGSADPWPDAITRLVQDMETLDTRFLEEAQHRVAAITQALADLKSGGDDSAMQKNLQTAFREIALLFESAQGVEARVIMQFLHGLETFLGGIAYKGAPLIPQRLEQVVSRLDTLFPLTQQWVETGRAERAAIRQVLAQPLGAEPALAPDSPPSVSFPR